MPSYHPLKITYPREQCHLTDAEVWDYFVQLFNRLQIATTVLEDLREKALGTPLEQYDNVVLQTIAHNEALYGVVQIFLEGYFAEASAWWHPIARFFGFKPEPVCVWKKDPKALENIRHMWEKTHGPWPPKG
jgi:hypothetical protein